MLEIAETIQAPVDYATLLRIGRELLEAIGEDPEREGLRDTPRRFADWWRDKQDMGVLLRMCSVKVFILTTLIFWVKLRQVAGTASTLGAFACIAVAD